MVIMFGHINIQLGIFIKKCNTLKSKKTHLVDQVIGRELFNFT